MMDTKKVYISIVNYNNSTQTIQCIESILKLDYDNYKIILVDNNSSDNSLNDLEKWFSKESISCSYKTPLDDNNKVTIIKSNYTI